MSDVARHVGQKIRELRKAEGLTQERLAREMKVTPNTVSRWETSTYKPSIDDLERLSRVFRTAIWVFFPTDLRPEEPPTEHQRALLSATGDLPTEDIEELVRYADFVRARKALRKAKSKRARRGPKRGAT